MTSMMSTGKPQTFKPVFLKNVILQLLLFKNLRQHGHMPLKSEVSYEVGTSFKELKRVIVLGRAFMLLLISVVL